MTEKRKLFHETVAEKLIEQLEKGTAPWQRPWEPGEPGMYLPVNAETGKRYRGINAIHLMAQDRDDSRWMTYRQAQTAGYQVRRGEQGTRIQFWKFTEEKNKLDAEGNPVLDAEGKPVKEEITLERPRGFSATVFNAEQIEGMPPIERKPAAWDPIERAEKILEASGASISHNGGARAFYRLGTDTIHLPAKGQFPDNRGYYATALHELGHWTGHESRLGRDLSHPFGSEGYAREELRAEIASMLVGDELGIGHDPGQHAAYVASWIKVLQDDPVEVFRAAAAAEKIQDYVLDLEQQRTLGQEEVPESEVARGAYEEELGRLLRLSTLTPGSYTPSEAVKNSNHAAVFAGDVPVLLCGASDDPASIAQAQALAASQHVKAAFLAAGHTGPIRSGVAAGPEVPWQAVESALVSKPSGQVEAGGDNGPLVAIVLNDGGHALTTSLCVTTETARIFDAGVPELDDGRLLPGLAGNAETLDQEAQAMTVETVSPEATVSPNEVPDQEKDGARREGQSEPAPEVQEKTYLNVSYREKGEAKALGARWDPKAKSWYAGSDADMKKLERYLPNHTPSQDPAMTPREEFGEALRGIGAVVEGPHPIMDGKTHRIHCEGDKGGELAGFYVAHLDGRPAGYIKNNRTGVEVRWKSKGYCLDPEQKAQLAAQAAEKLQARAAEQTRRHEETAQRIQEQIENLLTPTGPTTYLVSKGLPVRPGILTDAEGEKTFIPAHDTDGKVWTMQYIREDGTKRFAKNSRKEGCFHAIGGIEELAKAPAIVIAEGYATAGSLSEALGFSTVAAFDSGNVPAVATALHEKFPDKAMVIAGDDDTHLESRGVNPGRTKALEAARAVGGKAVFPIFAPGEQSADRHGFTDFNDLATNSVLGKEAVARQVKPIVEFAIKRHRKADARHVEVPEASRSAGLHR